MGWEKLKRFLGLRLDPADSNEASIQQLVSQNLLNRRKNFRVNYPPHGGGGPYPTVYFQGTELILSNISVGGCLVIDDTDKLGTTVGEIISLDFIWPAFRTTIRTRIVGVTLDNRHMQFVDFDARFFLQINQLVPAALAGSRFRHVQNRTGRLAAAEMWTSHMSDTLIFSHDGSAELSLKGEKFRWPPLNISNIQRIGGSNAPDDGAARLTSSTDTTKLALIYVTLANFPHPSERVTRLIERIAIQLERRETRVGSRDGDRKREGTNG